MTKSTITRERLQEIAEDGFLKHGESKELARMALAAMDSEPVAYIFKHPSGKLFWALTDESNKGRRDVMPVYAAPQPAPVVSEDLYKLANHIASSKNGLPDEWQDWAEELESDIRRAAMPRTEPVTTANKLGNSPVIPDTWIPVSERMPIPGVDVLVAKEFFGPGDWRRKVGHVRHEDSGWNIYGASWAPTHWMPLPAAPQEVK